MSKYGHYSQQYFGNKIEFPKESFKISGISFYQKYLDNINYESKLIMVKEPNNKYDSTAIKILYKDNLIGYVPNNGFLKELCNENINEALKIINIKRIKGTYGIRVIPNKLYIPNEALEKQIFFAK